jgi:hypothetical protein
MEMVSDRLNGHRSSWALSTRTFFSLLWRGEGQEFFSMDLEGRAGGSNCWQKNRRSNDAGKWLRMSYDSM